MRPEFEQEYRESGDAPIVLAGLVWKTLIGMIVAAVRELPPDQALTVRYEALVADPRNDAARRLEFCGLEPSPRFDQRVRQIQISDADDKW